MATIMKSVDVHVPVHTAYNQWTQFESFPKFMEGVNRVKQIDDTHLEWDVNVGGVNRQFQAVIDEQRPDERVAWHATDGPKQAGVVTFHRLDEDQTRVTVQMEWEPEGVTEKAGAVLGFDDRRVQGDLDRFREFIESRGAEEGAWRGEVTPPEQHEAIPMPGQPGETGTMTGSAPQEGTSGTWPKPQLPE